jgi:hypothetical protein
MILRSTWFPFLSESLFQSKSFSLIPLLSSKFHPHFRYYTPIIIKHFSSVTKKMAPSFFQRQTIIFGTSTACLYLHLTPSKSENNRGDAVKSCVNSRVVHVRGNATQRGEQMWTMFGKDVTQLASNRRELYSVEGISLWNQMAKNCEDSWKKYAPVSWAELEAMSHKQCQYKGEQHQRSDDLRCLGTDFEMQMLAWRYPHLNNNNIESIDVEGTEGGSIDASDVSPSESAPPGKCTAFALVHRQLALCGQNVDEDGSGWLEGSKDILLKLMSDDPKVIPHAMVYTHPGTPAYCGMNSSGLSVLCLYIDNPSTSTNEIAADDDEGALKEDTVKVGRGLPIDVTIRELLTHHTIADAICWLQKVPRIAPTTYLILQGKTIVCVEVSQDRIVTCFSQPNEGGSAQICHSNHPLFDEMMFPPPSSSSSDEVESDEKRDAIGGTVEDLSQNYSSHNRLSLIRNEVSKLRRIYDMKDDNNVDSPLDRVLEASKRLLESCPAAHPTCAPTLASVLLDPHQLKMHIKFRGDIEWISESFE